MYGHLPQNLLQELQTSCSSVCLQASFLVRYYLGDTNKTFDCQPLSMLGPSRTHLEEPLPVLRRLHPLPSEMLTFFPRDPSKHLRVLHIRCSQRFASGPLLLHDGFTLLLWRRIPSLICCHGSRGKRIPLQRRWCCMCILTKASQNSAEDFHHSSVLRYLLPTHSSLLEGSCIF